MIIVKGDGGGFLHRKEGGDMVESPLSHHRGGRRGVPAQERGKV